MTSYAYDGKDFFEIYFDKMLLFTKNNGISYTYVLRYENNILELNWNKTILFLPYKQP